MGGEMSVRSEYLEFDRLKLPGRKTPVVNVLSKSSGTLLGRIAWYGPWRQFCFMPEPQTVFNAGCMRDIEAAVDELRAERAERRPRTLVDALSEPESGEPPVSTGPFG